MLRKQEEEKWKIEELKTKEMVFIEALKDEVYRRVERDKLLKEAQEKKKARLAFFKSEHWQRARADMPTIDKRSQKDGSESSYYWSSKFVEAEKIRIPPKGCRDLDMTEFLKDVKPWVEV